MLEPDPPFRDPRDLQAYLLEITRRATVTGDFEAFWPRFELPHEAGTGAEVRILHSKADLRAVFDGVQAHMRSISATDLHCTVTGASFDGPDRLNSTHISSWVVAGRHLTEPYSCRSLAIRRDGVWRIKAGIYAVDHVPLFRRAILDPTPILTEDPDAQD